MKKKILSIMLFIVLLFPINNVYAYGQTQNDIYKDLYPDWYNEEGKIKLYPTWYEKEGKVLNAEIYNIDWAIPKLAFLGMDGKVVLGTMTYPNYNNQVLGNFDLQWIFTPDDSETYEIRSGVFHFLLWAPDSEASKGKIPDIIDIIEATTTPSLTVTSIQLDNTMSYDINLNDKISGSDYLWSTDNTEIIDVNSNNGKIKAKKEGNAKVTCEITLPDGNKNILETIVTVGYDENAPLLTETLLDLEVGDKFDINLENKVAKSKYRWVSSNRDVVIVNSSNGKVTAIGEGEAYVTCTITTPENQVIVLKCDINVTELYVITE